jgi:hypothetical protein
MFERNLKGKGPTALTDLHAFFLGPSGMIGLHASHAVGTTCVLGTKRVNPKNHHKIQKHTTTLKLSQFQKYYQPLSLWRKKFDFQFSTTIEV